LATIFLMQSCDLDMQALIARLYPICRSITGDGVRQTLRILGEFIPLQVHEVATGTTVFDWTIPKEWNIRDAWIKDSHGQKLIDFGALNLHVVGYSSPIRRRMRLAELREHLFTIPQRPGWVPYRSSYYNERWGFCLSEEQLSQFRDGEEYEVLIDSSLENGYLTYGETVLRGEEETEVLISSHVCHPSLGNDNLSGIAVAVKLARVLATRPRRYTYRFLFAPGTIGSITWLARNEERLSHIKHGVVLTCLGDLSDLTYKRSRRGDAEIDRAFVHVLKHSGKSHSVLDFVPSGYDERQYCSPGINLPVGCVMRGRHGEFPEYHTSADNLDLVKDVALEDSFAKCFAAFEVLEGNRVYLNRKPKGEPQLGRRNLYDARQTGGEERQRAYLWVLNLSDGEHSLLDIAERANLPFDLIRQAAEALAATDLLSLQQTAR
jgi:aminopeptidase-like protein